MTNPPVCDIPDCEKKHLAKGLCRMHYYQLQRTGTTDAAPPRTRGTCTVDGCEETVHGNGLCTKHYQQVKAHGEVRPDVTAQDRFWGKVDRDAPGGCWLWTGSTTNGYGYISVDGRFYRVHRYSYELANGPIPDGAELDHTCHDHTCRRGVECPHRRCVNPAHLDPVTHKANMASDRSSLGVQAGERQRAKTHCPKGHPYNEANTYTAKQGYRRCRACDREKQRERRGA